MEKIELIIDGTLCDITESFNVRLNRQLLNPAELNTKDAQYSYSISLPLTDTNNRIFKFANIEETRDKFNREFSAELAINSVRIFKGLFRLSGIDNKHYKGNLYIPSIKTIKDIFGETKLNENAEYRIEFKDFTEYVSKYNEDAANNLQMAIFPYVLYGILPKTTTQKDNSYSPREVWDSTVRMGMNDIPPAINPLMMLKHIFDGRKRNEDGTYTGEQKYNLIGTAFNDERLTRLYMSYKNPPDYTQPWNYGQHAKMSLKGSWLNYDRNKHVIERGGYKTSQEGYDFFTCDLFRSTCTKITVLDNPGGNIKDENEISLDGTHWVNWGIHIPVSGYYKVRLRADLEIHQNFNFVSSLSSGMTFVGGSSENYKSNLAWRRYEIKLLRDFKTGDFGISNSHIDGIFYKDNQPQNKSFDPSHIEDSPKYFPQAIMENDKEKQILFVDPAQNPNIVVGLSWGYDENHTNPKNNDRESRHGRVLAAKPSLSWDNRANLSKITRLGINSPGYWRWGKLENSAEDPGIDLSESSMISGQIFDPDGLFIPLPSIKSGWSSTILNRIKLNDNSTYTIDTPPESNWNSEVFLYNSPDEKVKAIRRYEGKAGDTLEINTSDGAVYLSLLLTLTTNTDTFDVKDSLKLRTADINGDDYGWVITDKYKAKINGSPDIYCRRGYKNGQFVSTDWNGDGAVSAIVWLEAGEMLTLSSISDDGNYKPGKKSTWGWTTQQLDFELEVTPFRIEENWLKVAPNGNGTGAMSWNDPVNFDTDSIDLVKFLPSDIKTDDFINNFCKAFNLELSHPDEKTFRLDVKQSKKNVSKQYVNLDQSASVSDKANQPLGLPSAFNLGFTVDTEEEGYIKSGKFDGGGEFKTGAIDTKPVEQKSIFSYNWYKQIQKTEQQKNIPLLLPVISKAEAWNSSMNDYEAMKKRYTNSAIRFWYYDGLLNSDGATFYFPSDSEDEISKKQVKLARVSNELENLSVLSYENKPLTILSNYFTILVNNSSHYTEIEGYLTAMQYEALDGSRMAMFNNDLYYVAEISGYDPASKNKTKIKLIRSI